MVLLFVPVGPISCLPTSFGRVILFRSEPIALYQSAGAGLSPSSSHLPVILSSVASLETSVEERMGR